MSGRPKGTAWAGIALGIALAAWVVIEATNVIGGDVLGRYFAEYAGGGSCAWRGTEGRLFQALLLVLGLPGHVAAVAAAWIYGRRACRATRRRRAPVGDALAAAAGVAVLVRMIWLGVARAAIEIC